MVRIPRSVDLVTIVYLCCEYECYVRITMEKQIGELSPKESSFFISIGLSLLQFLFYKSNLYRIASDAELVKNI